MSSASSTPETFVPEADVTDAAALVRRTIGSARESAQFAAFCAAILFPLTYLPLLADGLPLQEAVLLVSLLAAHAVTLAVGHGYGDEQ